MKTERKKSKNKINIDNKKTIKKNYENKAETINNNKDNQIIIIIQKNNWDKFKKRK